MEMVEAGSETRVIDEFATEFEGHIVSALRLQLSDEFADLAALKNLQGTEMGFARVYTHNSGLIEKAAFMSLTMMPGMRYFNIHVIPNPELNIPRFSFEGMLNPKGSQISIDLYPDLDVMMNLDYFKRHYRRVESAYREARFDKPVETIEASRMAHMRACCSPYFLLAYGVASEHLRHFSRYAQAYLADWLDICASPEKNGPAETLARKLRRERIMQAIIEADPDRDKVVMLFGEELTQRIEQATML
ncbi:hypothetical protein [Microbulbifer agarilyticus]|uniref:hypothetical protein n=1 Tax=Microbulbifer agarilyticus TaxID=260552 RepID=UPI001CD436A7|nr:hypothetical protein [Microbulbifer agarilyticus]MCA0892042.1 hypothetical protein [Microbulbifer agarilyticus]